MQKKIGIILDNFMSSQLAYQALTQHQPDGYNVYGFYQNIGIPVIEPSFPLWHCSEIYHFDGYLIATNINAAQQLLNVFSAKQKIFYIWDLEWFRNKGSYEYYYSVYCNPNLTLVTRCEDYRNIIMKCWNVDCEIVTDVNYGEFASKIFV